MAAARKKLDKETIEPPDEIVYGVPRRADVVSAASRKFRSARKDGRASTRMHTIIIWLYVDDIVLQAPCRRGRWSSGRVRRSAFKFSVEAETTQICQIEPSALDMSSSMGIV